MIDDDLLTLQTLIVGGDHDAAERLLGQMHRRYQREPFAHARVHFAWARIACMRRSYVAAAGHWLAAVVFAVPVSLWQKWIG